MTTVINHAEIEEALSKLAQEIHQAHHIEQSLAIVGIADGGIRMAKRMANLLKEKFNRHTQRGVVNASFHRDDIGANPIPKSFNRTDLDFIVDDAHIILVDDVIFSGRTVRASLSELFDHGRPKKIELAVLCSRPGKVLPITPDYCGFNLDISPTKNVRVTLNETPKTTDSISVE